MRQQSNKYGIRASALDTCSELKLLFADLFSRAVYYNKQTEVNELANFMALASEECLPFDLVSSELKKYCDLLTLPPVPMSGISELIDNLGHPGDDGDLH
jgi:hypothetical protein